MKKNSSKTPKSMRQSLLLHRANQPKIRHIGAGATLKSLKNKQQAFFQTKQQLLGKKVVQHDITKPLLRAIAGACVVLLSVLLLHFTVLDSNSTLVFSKGTTLNGVSIGNMDTYRAAQVVYDAFMQKSETFELTLNYLDQTWHFDKSDFTVNSDIFTIMEEAQQRDRANLSYQTQQDTINKLQQNGSMLSVAFNYLFVGLDEKIDSIIQQISKTAEDSVLTFTPNAKQNFTITHETAGLKVNKEQLYYDINQAFLKSNQIVVTIPTLPDEPRVTYEQNVANSQMISSFKTNVSDSTGNRKSNVALALKRINGLVVQPDEKISFNRLTAPHSLNNGYKVATIIFNGEFVDGVGGGICQASTTLYNALLLADVQINQVVKHTLPVKYVPLGLDAMVADGVADLVFTNTSPYPLYIKTITTADDVQVQIFSHVPQHGMTLKTRSEVIRKIAHKGDIIKQDTKHEYGNKVLYVGEQYRLSYPKNGYEVKAYVDYYKDGQLITSKEIRHETYAAQQGVVIEGVEPKPAEFTDADQKVEKVKAQEDSSQTFLFGQAASNLPESVETSFCP